MRKPPPISTSSPRATMTSLRAASAASARSTAAALLFATSASSEPARSARSRAAWPWRSPRLPRARSYSTLTAPAASTIAASARADGGARSPRDHLERTRPNADREILDASDLAIELRRGGLRKLDLDDARALCRDRRAVHVRAAVQLREGEEGFALAKVACEDDVELPVVELCLRRDAHAAAKVRRVRGDDREEAAGVQLAVDEHAHGDGLIGRDAREGAREPAETGTDDAHRRDDALGHVAVDPHAGRIQEDASVRVADVDRPSARGPDEPRNVPAPARVPERAREVVPGPDRIERERRAAADETVGDLVRGPVAPDSDDHAVSGLGRLAREPRPLTLRGRALDLDPQAGVTERARDPRREALAGAVPRGRVHDRQGTVVGRAGRRGHQLPLGASALRIASCSSSDSAWRERPLWTCFAKTRVSVRLCRLESTIPLPSASRSAIAKDWSPPVSAKGLKRTTPTRWMVRCESRSSSWWSF